MPGTVLSLGLTAEVTAGQGLGLMELSHGGKTDNEQINMGNVQCDNCHGKKESGGLGNHDRTLLLRALKKERISPCLYGQKCVPGRWNSQCKGPEVEPAWSTQEIANRR